MGIFNSDNKNNNTEPQFHTILPHGMLLNSGFEMQGNINMNDRRIFNLSTNPVTDDDVISKRFVDNYKFRSDEFLRVDGSNMMVGVLNANDQRIGPIGDAVNQYDCVHKHYVDTLDEKNLKINESRKLQTFIDMNDFHIYNLKMPTGNDHAANKHYVDNAIQTHIIPFNDKLFLKTDGSNTMLNTLDMNNNRILNVLNAQEQTDAVNLQQMNQIAAAFASNSLNSQTGGSVFDNLDMKNNHILNLGGPVSLSDAVTKEYVDLKTDGIFNEKLYLKLDGSQAMKGDLDMSGFRLTGLNTHQVDLHEAVSLEHAIYLNKRPRLTFYQRLRSDAPAPFNYEASDTSGLYGLSTGNNPIKYGATISAFTAMSCFEYTPINKSEQSTKIQPITFVNRIANAQSKTIWSGFGVGSLSSSKQSIQLKKHLLHRICAYIFFSNLRALQDVKYAIQIDNVTKGFLGSSQFQCNALCVFGDISDRPLTIRILNPANNIKIRYVRVEIYAIGAFHPGYFSKF